MTCIHLRGATGERVQCPTCLRMVRVKVFICAVREKCSIATPVQVDGEEIACCKFCHLKVEG